MTRVHPGNRKPESSSLHKQGRRGQGQRTFDLVVKTYFPNENQPGGAMSNIYDFMPIGEKIEVKGPTGEIEYNDNGNFVLEGKETHFECVTLILGGSDITPGYQLTPRILETEDDDTEIAVIDANKSEADILLREELDKLQKEDAKQIRFEYVLSLPSGQWRGKKGHVNADIIKANAFEAKDDSAAFLCGPPAMIQEAALPASRHWGLVEEENCFGF